MPSLVPRLEIYRPRSGAGSYQLYHAGALVGAAREGGTATVDWVTTLRAAADLVKLAGGHVADRQLVPALVLAAQPQRLAPS